MGFTCELKEIFSFVYKVEFEENLFENEYDHVFIGRYDGQVLPNKDEVDDFKWVDFIAVKNDIKENPELYTYWFRKLVDTKENEFYKYISS